MGSTLIACLVAGSLITGCGTSAAAATDSSSKTAATSNSSSTLSPTDSTAAASLPEASASTDASNLFSDRDLEQTADTSDAETITIKESQDVPITSGGVYVISGTASDVTIRVETSDDEKVQLVLDGVNITNEDSPAIYVVSADKVFVTTAEGTNSSLTVNGTFSSDGETNTDAVIFSKDDITLNGLGSLTVTSKSGNGITSKNELTVTGGTWSVTASGHALEAHDAVNISGGTFELAAGKDGIHSSDSDDDTVGSVYISGGTFTIKSDDDGIHGTTTVTVDGGTFDITAVEGIEGTSVEINDGTINISASDDGINATQKTTSLDAVISINGGDITITMGSGDTDAVDANGSIYVNGGSLDITGMSAFDYDNEGVINGGTVTVNGEEVAEMPASMMGGGGRGERQGGFNRNFAAPQI